MKLKLLNKGEILSATKNHDAQKLTKIINNFQKKTDQQSSLSNELSAEINFVDDSGLPLMHHTIVGPDDFETKRFERSFECFKILLCCNVDINMVDTKRKQTALHVAAKKGNRPILELLLTQLGIIVEIRDIAGNTPLILAAENNHLEVVKMLLKANADIHARNLMNQSAFDIAASRDAKEVLAFLMPKMADFIGDKKHLLFPRPRVEMRNNAGGLLQLSNSSYSLTANKSASRNGTSAYNQRLFDFHNPSLPSSATTIISGASDTSKRPTSFSLFFERHRNYMRSSSVAPSSKFTSGVMTSSYDSSGFSDKNDVNRDNNSASLEDITLCDKKKYSSDSTPKTKASQFPLSVNGSKMPDLTCPQHLMNQWTQSYSNLNQSPSNYGSRQKLNQPIYPGTMTHNHQHLQHMLLQQPEKPQGNNNYYSSKFSPSPHQNNQQQQFFNGNTYQGHIMYNSSTRLAHNMYQNDPSYPQQSLVTTQHHRKFDNQTPHRSGESSVMRACPNVQQDIIIQRSRDTSSGHQHHPVTPNDYIILKTNQPDNNNLNQQRIHPTDQQQTGRLSDANNSGPSCQILNQMKQLNINNSNRNSAASLDSGRGSECTNSDIARNNSSQNGTSNQSDIQLAVSGISSSSSSSYSASSPTKALNTSDLIGLPQPMTKISQVDSVQNWTKSIGLERYSSLITEAGYDLPTLTKATSDDLITLGVTNPRDRQALRRELNKLTLQPLPVGFTTKIPKDLSGWLQSLDLKDEYFPLFQAHCVNTLNQVSQLNWEDLQDLGITKLGHQKKLILAIEYMNRAIKLGSFTLQVSEHGAKNEVHEDVNSRNPTSYPYSHAMISDNNSGSTMRNQQIYPSNKDVEKKNSLPRLPPKQFQDGSSDESIREECFNGQDLNVLQTSLLPLPKTNTSRITDEIQGDMADVMRVLQESGMRQE